MRRDLLILACAISAGIHGALAPAHFEEGRGAGLGFVAATVALAAVAVAVRLRPASPVALAGAATLFGGLLAGYALATTTGLPVLHPEPEPVDGLALVTKAVELVGLLAASTLLYAKGIEQSWTEQNDPSHSSSRRSSRSSRPLRPSPSRTAAPPTRTAITSPPGRG